MPPTPRYEGEDTRPTSEKELRGWFSYGIAAEVYAVCGVGKQRYGYAYMEYSGLLNRVQDPSYPLHLSNLLESVESCGPTESHLVLLSHLRR